MFIKNFLDYFESINDGLIKTHRGDLSVSYIVDTLKRLKFNINGDFNNDIIKIEFIYVNPQSIVEYYQIL